MSKTDSAARQIVFNPEFEITWAGSNPFGWPGLCFGTDHGSLLFTDETGQYEVSPELHVSKSQEAINAVSWVGHCLAASTRSDITFFKKIPDKPLAGFSENFGAHGVIRGQGNTFFAPLGKSGLLLVELEDQYARFRAFNADRGPDLNYMYRVALLPGKEGQESVVCASRKLGVSAVVIDRSGQDQLLRTAKFRNVDVIDVCPLPSPTFPRAFVAAGRDGTLIFFRDALVDQVPQFAHFADLLGSVYRVLTCRGHLAILTSVAVYIIFDIANRFAAGDDVRKIQFGSYAFEAEAVDMTLHRDEEFVVVHADDKVTVINVPVLERSAAARAPSRSKPNQERDDTNIEWEEREMAMTSRLVPAGC